MSHGWDTLKLTRIIAATNPGNRGSIRLLEKLGMRFEQMIFDAASKSDMKLFAANR